jgi:hypothetical protein
MWEGAFAPRLIASPNARCRDTQVPPTLEGSYFVAGFPSGADARLASPLEELESAFKTL